MQKLKAHLSSIGSAIMKPKSIEVNLTASHEDVHVVTLPTVDASTVDASTVDASTVDKSTVDESTVDASTVDESTVDKSTVDESTVDASTVDKSTVDKSTVDESTVDKSTVDESTVDESTVDKSTVDDKATDTSQNDESEKRLDEFPEFPSCDDIFQYGCRMVESRIGVMSPQEVATHHERVIKSQINQIVKTDKNTKADMKKLEELDGYFKKVAYDENEEKVDISSLSKASGDMSVTVYGNDQLTADVDFLLMEKEAQKEDLEELLEKLNAFKAHVVLRAKKLSQSITRIKAEHGLLNEREKANQCLRELMMKVKSVDGNGVELRRTKIPLPSANCQRRTIRSRNTNDRRIQREAQRSDSPAPQKVENVEIQNNPGDDMAIKSRMIENHRDHTQNKVIKSHTNGHQKGQGKFTNIKSKLNTGRGPSVERPKVVTEFKRPNVVNVSQSAKGYKKKEIKSKIDTGRGNKVKAPGGYGNGHELYNDIKARSEMRLAFANKPVLPGIQNGAQRNLAATCNNISWDMNGNNKRALLSKIEGQKCVNDLMDLRRESPSPMLLNHERYSPLPPIKSARGNAQNELCSSQMASAACARGYLDPIPAGIVSTPRQGV